MAATLVGGALLGGAFNVLLDRLSSPELIKFFRGRKLDESLLKKLELTLLELNKVLNDAEEKQITDRAVKAWLDKLKDAVYHAEDLVDEIRTEALRSTVQAEYPRGIQSFLDSVISPVKGLFGPDGMNSKLKEMIGELDHFVEAKDVLGLREVAGSPTRLPTTSLVDESCVYGRENDKEAIMKLLLSDGESSNKIDVIPIVGMGGMGKTTLAQLLYNDGRLDGHFVKKAWVCVSDVFDVESVTRTIVEAVDGRSVDARDLNSLQVKLKDSLSGKKFLIVLDDVWNENYNYWNALMTPFRFGAHGSKIIVTTRNESVASIMKTVPINGLQKLSEEDCWELFSKHAFEEGDCNAHPDLVRIGQDIVRKCDGLPLAVKILGGLLRSERDPKNWENILESAIWESELSKEILPALRLSYHYLPSHLKRCFACCSIIFKDYIFNMDELVSIWIAEGFLEKPKNSKTVEEEGYECFRELLSRSFFQRSNHSDSFISLYVMHDLVHDLAQSVMGDFCDRLEDGNPHGIAEKVRYFSFAQSEFDSFEKLKEIKEAKCLRTFLPLKPKYFYRGHLSEKVMVEILPGLTRLRLLSLSKYRIKELPYSIGNLTHLRFLDLSQNDIRELPESVGKLYNLETLLLFECNLLTTLPADLVKLISLRRLDLTGTKLKEMPMNMSRLKNIQQLTNFVVGKCTSINELGEFHCLRGTISISGLQNVQRGHDALEAKIMSEKKHLKKLALEWDSPTEDSLLARDVLEKLEPHTNLKHLEIKNYGGTRFPTWLGDQSFCNMVSLRLENCENCFFLPTLGQMPSLKELTIKRMPGIKSMGHEFYGESGSSRKPFQSLETLRFEKMSGWVDWCILDAGEFTRLRNLQVIECPKLFGHLPTNLPSLVYLSIEHCPKLVSSLPETTSLRWLSLIECQGMQLEWQGVPSVEELYISSFPSLKEFGCELATLKNLKLLTVDKCPSLSYFPLSEEMSHCYTSLKELKVSKCDTLRSLPLGLFSQLQHLQIEDCVNFETLLIPDGIELNLISLSINDCNNMLSFPCGGLPAPILSSLSLHSCKKLKALPKQMHTLLPSLRQLGLRDCPELESFLEGDLPSKLSYLTIRYCKKCVGGRRDWGLQTLPSLISLSLRGEFEDALESFPEEGLLPSTLKVLRLEQIPNLKSLNNKGLQHLGSLETMDIQDCPQLQSLPEEGLPTSLVRLTIWHSPLLKPRCRREEGEDWHKIAHIPLIEIDGEVIRESRYAARGNLGFPLRVWKLAD